MQNHSDYDIALTRIQHQTCVSARNLGTRPFVTYNVTKPIETQPKPQNETHTSKTPKEEQTPMEKQQVLEDLKNALKQANEKLAELEKAESDKEAKIAEQDKELQELKDFKKKIKELLV